MSLFVAVAAVGLWSPYAFSACAPQENPTVKPVEEPLPMKVIRILEDEKFVVIPVEEQAIEKGTISNRLFSDSAVEKSVEDCEDNMREAQAPYAPIKPQVIPVSDEAKVRFKIQKEQTEEAKKAENRPYPEVIKVAEEPTPTQVRVSQASTEEMETDSQKSMPAQEGMPARNAMDEKPAPQQAEAQDMDFDEIEQVEKVVDARQITPEDPQVVPTALPPSMNKERKPAPAQKAQPAKPPQKENKPGVGASVSAANSAYEKQGVEINTTVGFLADETSLYPAARKQLTEAIDKHRNKNAQNIIMTMHIQPPPLGMDVYTLGRKRAQSIMALLREQGVNPNKAQISHIYVLTDTKQLVELSMKVDD